MDLKYNNSNNNNNDNDDDNNNNNNNNNNHQRIFKPRGMRMGNGGKYEWFKNFNR